MPLILKHEYTGNWGRVVLKPLEEPHIEAIRILRNQHRKSFVYSGEISAEEQKVWYGNYLKTPNDYMFSVYRADTGAWVGSNGIYKVDPMQQTAEFGRLLIERQADGVRGLGADTTICSCMIACSCLRVERVTLEVYENNLPAIKTYLRAGFHPIGEFMASAGGKMTRMEYKSKDGEKLCLQFKC